MSQENHNAIEFHTTIVESLKALDKLYPDSFNESLRISEKQYRKWQYKLLEIQEEILKHMLKE
jgi:hypothetical protein